MRNDFTLAERDLLTVELLNDPTTRLFAARYGGLTLDVWAAVKTASYVASLTGADLVLPTPRREQTQAPRRAEVERARKRLQENSVIADLPVI